MQSMPPRSPRKSEQEAPSFPRPPGGLRPGRARPPRASRLGRLAIRRRRPFRHLPDRLPNELHLAAAQKLRASHTPSPLPSRATRSHKGCCRCGPPPPALAPRIGTRTSEAKHQPLNLCETALSRQATTTTPQSGATARTPASGLQNSTACLYTSWHRLRASSHTAKIARISVG